MKTAMIGDNCIDVYVHINGEVVNRRYPTGNCVDTGVNLRKLGIPPEVIRKISIAMYEGEINMVIHADGGEADVLVYEDRIVMILTDRGPGIADVEKAMQEGYSTAPDNVRSLGFGAGMGLPNMKRYTDDMKIESVVGEGTTITMTVLLA